jgi:hypothetical protein
LGGAISAGHQAGLEWKVHEKLEEASRLKYMRALLMHLQDPVEFGKSGGFRTQMFQHRGSSLDSIY